MVRGHSMMERIMWMQWTYVELECYSIFSSVLYDVDVEVSNYWNLDENFKK